MGSSPESLRFLLQQLQCRPHTIRWSAPRPVLLRRGDNHKLGFHFKTFSCRESVETVTVVVLVKGDCRIDQGSLQAGDRIVRVGSVDVTPLSEGEVKHVLGLFPDCTVPLHVAVMSRPDSTNSQVKRFPSVNSGASGGSVTASVDSVERPQVKRFQKSSSTETPPTPSPLSDRASRSTDQNQPGVVETPPVRRPQPCVPRECVAYKRPGVPTHSPHLHNAYNSLPDRMEDDIVLPDDIVLCEADEPTSLPPVLNPLPPNTHRHPPVGVYINTVSTGIGGAPAVGGESHTGSAGQNRVMGVEVCRMPGCSGHRTCLWHKFVLSSPQYVVWEPLTKTVVLEKNNAASFGFKYKVKKYDGPPAEVFAIVTEVTPGGPAWNLLLSGDWIRSIDGTPVNTAKEAFSPDFQNLSSLRLVIQRPEGLSWRGVTKLRQLARSMGIALHIPPPPPNHAAPAPHSPRPKPRQLDRQGGGGGGGEEGGRVVVREVDPLLDQYPRQAQSPGEYIALTVLPRQGGARGSDRCVLPQARVVVCGAHGSAADLVRGLLGERCTVDLDPEAPAQSFQISLHRSDLGTFARSQREILAAIWGSGECGQEGEGGLRCMNVEVYVINDEHFFHHCCSWLLPSTTLLLLTFHVQKLLNQPQVETGRLAAMVHTAQSCTRTPSSPITTTATDTPSSNILLYGVPSGSQRDVSAEEVQVMFYVTDSGSRLLERHGLSVNVATPTCGRSMAAAREALFSACHRRLCETPTPQCVLRVVDALSGVSGVKISGGEVGRLVSGALGEGDSVVVQSVVSCLLDTGCLLLPSGSSRSLSRDPNQQEYLLPFNTFQALSLLMTNPLLDTHSVDNRQKWFRLITTGRVPRAELVDLLAQEGSTLIVDLLEQLGVIFPFHPSNARGDSGFAEDSRDFLVPYFLQEVREDRQREERFVVRFDQHLSWRGYYEMMGRLSALPATEEVDVRGQCDCVVRHNGLCVQCRKDSGSDAVFVAVNRSQGGRDRATVQEVEQLFSAVIPPSVLFKVQVVDTSSPSSNLPSRETDTVHPPSATPGVRCNDAPLEETFVKPVMVGAEASSLVEEGEEDYSNLPLTALPWSVINRVAILLTIPMPTGHDWKSVAEKAGKSMPEIFAYEVVSSREMPAMSFLREWILTGTVQQFLDILESLERPDVLDVILDHLRGRSDAERS